MASNPPRRIEWVVVRLMDQQDWTLALAESCTGGLIANAITNVPGASKIFRGGIVAYSNDAKRKFLSVHAATLDRHGAVSRAVAKEMAEGARRKFGSDFAIAVTGIAGPAGGTIGKPVGTVFIALAARSGATVEHRLNHLSRHKFKEITARQALQMLLTRLKSDALSS